MALILPKILEPIWGQFRIADGMLNILMPKVALQRARIDSTIRQFEAASVPEHVRMNLDTEPSLLSGTFQHLRESHCREWRAKLGHEDKRACIIFTL